MKWLKNTYLLARILGRIVNYRAIVLICVREQQNKNLGFFKLKKPKYTQIKIQTKH